MKIEISDKVQVLLASALGGGICAVLARWMGFVSPWLGLVLGALIAVLLYHPMTTIRVIDETFRPLLRVLWEGTRKSLRRKRKWTIRKPRVPKINWDSARESIVAFSKIMCVALIMSVVITAIVCVFVAQLAAPIFLFELAGLVSDVSGTLEFGHLAGVCFAGAIFIICVAYLGGCIAKIVKISSTYGGVSLSRFLPERLLGVLSFEDKFWDYLFPTGSSGRNLAVGLVSFCFLPTMCCVIGVCGLLLFVVFAIDLTLMILEGTIAVYKSIFCHPRLAIMIGALCGGIASLQFGFPANVGIGMVVGGVVGFFCHLIALVISAIAEKFAPTPALE